MKNVPYSSATRSLMYVEVCTRPDIAYAASLLGRYSSNPDHEHWVGAKKVLRYLKKTKGYLLVYKKVDNIEVSSYADSNFAGYSADMKSTTGYIFMLAGGAISWKSFKQSLVASSMMQAEIIACFEAGLMPYVFFTKNTNNSGGAKYIDLKYFKIREWVNNNDLYYEHIAIEDMVADPLTKGLRPIDFVKHVEHMSLLMSFDVFG
ncbi:secreted RxLR effector protein 161-like [Phoenix dactylifera]|uniref:Secreted RxLR effector protein 161-like n=1 Tax=Phoenix dactylifera TaxID=42345 RepID=A0A8B8ZP68_PHODC|nr:secreted RxLR effector protein 161-like [Phoenix dactylifera]